MTLTEKQRSALMHAYSDEYDLMVDDGWGDGHHPFTLRSLIKRGLLELDDSDDPLDCAELTTKGLHALGIRKMAAPKRASTALRRAVRALVPELEADHLHLGRQVSRVCVEEGPYGNLYSDVSDVIGAVQDTSIDEDGDVLWTCVAKLATEMGHPMIASRVRHLVYFHPDDE